MDITITVEQCIDDTDQWVWSLLDDNKGVIRDGYSSSESEGWTTAREEKRELLKELSQGSV